MSGMLLAGLTILVIGDSHMTATDYLITTLHDGLMAQGAMVYSYGICGAPAGDWMKTARAKCNGTGGTAERAGNGVVRERQAEAAIMKPLPDLLAKHHPNLIVVVNGDTMASYDKPVLPKAWVRDQVKTLTDGIQAAGLKCVWVGPAWGTEGGDNGKSYPRVREMSAFLADNVAPCIYIDSLKMSRPGEWAPIPHGTDHFDGQHFMKEGYQAWGRAITNEIVSSDILQKIKK